jgi:hypothetical protein
MAIRGPPKGASPKQRKVNTKERTKERSQAVRVYVLRRAGDDARGVANLRPSRIAKVGRTSSPTTSGGYQMAARIIRAELSRPNLQVYDWEHSTAGIP